MPNQGEGLAIASLVLGIISLVMVWCLFLGAPLAILAIIFGSMGLNKPGHGMAVAGLVMGAIELGLSTLIIVIGSMHAMWGPWSWYW